MLTVGRTVPDISFDVWHRNRFRKVSLSHFRGKWLVLLFYPADFTFICPTELEEAARSYEDFQTAGAEVISVSTDSVHVHKAWQAQAPELKNVTFPMAADPSGKMCRLFGTYIEEEGVSQRATYIIDPEGIVRMLDMHDNSFGRSIPEIRRRLLAARYVSEHEGEVCPASWQPGDKVLKEVLALAEEKK
jgi:alkyl hydroperoxide reductase subunit AhpC